MEHLKLLIIGAGPGGYVAAIRAAHLGLKTALVEKEGKLGGTCLLRGCIPTKSLLHSADLLQQLRGARSHGVVAGEVGFDFAGVQKAREKAVVKGAAGVSYLMKQNQVEVHAGVGRFVDSGTVEVTGAAGVARLVARHIIVASGSVPKQLPFLPVDGEHVVTSDELLAVARPPASLVVLGAGAVGIEFASIFSRFGTQCTVVEMLDRVLPIEDEEVSAELEKLLKKRGIRVHTGARLEQAALAEGQVKARLSGREGPVELEAEMLLVAVGRAPYTEGLGLEAAGLGGDAGGFIPVNGFMQTAQPGIYAIGDVVRTPQLAHVASAEALLAVDHLAGHAVRPLDYGHTPSCTYCDPEVASVGLSERAAREQGHDVKVGRFPFSALGKARVLGVSEGFVKVVAEAKYGELLGVHIIGPHATDLIAEAVVALELECTVEALARTMHAHPTLPEALLEAAHGAVSRPIHL